MAVCVMASVFMWRSCLPDGCLCDGICIHVEVVSNQLPAVSLNDGGISSCGQAAHGWEQLVARSF